MCARARCGHAEADADRQLSIVTPLSTRCIVTPRLPLSPLPFLSTSPRFGDFLAFANPVASWGTQTFAFEWIEEQASCCSLSGIPRPFGC